MFDQIFQEANVYALIPVQDANVRLIRELREEIDRLKSMLHSFEMVCVAFIAIAQCQLSWGYTLLSFSCKRNLSTVKLLMISIYQAFDPQT